MTADVLQLARAQVNAEQQMAGALNAAMNSPHTIIRLAQSGVAVRREGQPGRLGAVGHVLMIATPDGKRYDVPLNSHMVGLIVRDLTVEAA